MNLALPPDGNSAVPGKSSAVKAGWVCLVLGFVTFWIFGFGFIFFVATSVLAIVAMSTNRVAQGITLLVSSVGATVVCVVASIILLTGAFKSALVKERAARAEHHRMLTEETTPQAEGHRIPTEETTPRALLGPQKGSLMVNVNIASSEELQSLPNIGSSKADGIIANRPYQSVDELTKVPGITQRILDRMRPFIKTDGKTEKLQRIK